MAMKLIIQWIHRKYMAMVMHPMSKEEQRKSPHKQITSQVIICQNSPKYMSHKQNMFDWHINPVTPIRISLYIS